MVLTSVSEHRYNDLDGRQLTLMGSNLGKRQAASPMLS